jgi:hypothetical protein
MSHQWNVKKENGTVRQFYTLAGFSFHLAALSSPSAACHSPWPDGDHDLTP